MAVEQIEELRLQRGAGPVGVEVGEERILGVFEDERRVEPRAEPLGQRRFARADRSFDRDVAELQGGPMISSRRDAFADRAAARARRVRRARAPRRPSPPPARRTPVFEQKMAWILRLEDQRILRDPAPGAAACATAAAGAGARQAGRGRTLRPPPPPRAGSGAAARPTGRRACAAAPRWRSAASGSPKASPPLVGAARRCGSGSAADGGVRARPDRRPARARSARRGAAPIRRRS